MFLFQGLVVRLFLVVGCLTIHILGAMHLRLVQQRVFNFHDDCPVAMTTYQSTFIIAFSSGAVKMFTSVFDFEKRFFTTTTNIAQIKHVGTGILYASQEGVHFFWQPREDNLVGKFVSPENAINVAIGLMNYECAFGYQSGIIEVLEPTLKKVRIRLRGHDHGISSLIQLNHNVLVSGSEDGKIIVWSLHNGEHLWEAEFFNKGIRSIISTGYQNFVVVLTDGTILFVRRKVDTWVSKKIIKGDEHFCEGLPPIVAWPYLIAATPKGTLQFFSLRPDRYFQEIFLTNEKITALISLGNSLFAVASADGVLRTLSVMKADWV